MDCNCNGSKTVIYIVNPRNTEGYSADGVSLTDKVIRRTAEFIKGDIICCIISIRCFSNCYNGTSGIFINFFNIINVIINYQKTVLREKSDITSKRITDIVNVFKKSR